MIPKELPMPKYEYQKEGHQLKYERRDNPELALTEKVLVLCEPCRGLGYIPSGPYVMGYSVTMDKTPCQFCNSTGRRWRYTTVKYEPMEPLSPPPPA